MTCSKNMIYILCSKQCGPDSVTEVATRCGLDDTAIESQWGRDIPHPSRMALGPTQSLIQWLSFPGGKAAGAWP